MYHNFLIHSSADGDLGCFHVLAIVNSVAMNIIVPDLKFMRLSLDVDFGPVKENHCGSTAAVLQKQHILREKTVEASHIITNRCINIQVVDGTFFAADRGGYQAVFFPSDTTVDFDIGANCASVDLAGGKVLECALEFQFPEALEKH